MFLKALDLTTALRPSLLPDETLLFVQDAVGLYEGYVLVSFLLDGNALHADLNYQIQGPQLSEWSCIPYLPPDLFHLRGRAAETLCGD